MVVLRGGMFCMEKETTIFMPNAVTIAAIEEAQRMLEDPSTPKYSSMDALMAALDE